MLVWFPKSSAKGWDRRVHALSERSRNQTRYSAFTNAMGCTRSNPIIVILPLQFDYEGFVYDCFENGDTFPVLESLVIRNLKLSTEEPLFDNCKYMHLLTYICSYSKYLYFLSMKKKLYDCTISQRREK